MYRLLYRCSLLHFHNLLNAFFIMGNMLSVPISHKVCILDKFSDQVLLIYMKLSAPGSKQSHIAQTPHPEYFPWHWQITACQSVQKMNALAQNKNIIEAPHFDGAWQALNTMVEWNFCTVRWQFFWSRLLWEDNLISQFPPNYF